MTNLCFSRNQSFGEDSHTHVPPQTAPFCLCTVPPSAGSLSVVRLLRAPTLRLTGCIYKWSSLLQPSMTSYCYISMSASSSPPSLCFPCSPCSPSFLLFFLAIASSSSPPPSASQPLWERTQRTRPSIKQAFKKNCTSNSKTMNQLFSRYGGLLSIDL